MGLNLAYHNGQTPLDEDEKEGLRISSVTNRAELDELEQLNIEEALKWLIGKKFTVDRIFTEDFIRELHRRMFAGVWKWAGTFRQSDKNIGVHWPEIAVQLRQLLDNCRYWIDNNSYTEDEIAIRFKHELVQIHCFPNGNGRHSRLMADVIIDKIFGKPYFTWGSGSLVSAGEVRNQYIRALKQADQGDVSLLISFSRS